MPRQTLYVLEKQIRQADADAGQKLARRDQLSALKAKKLKEDAKSRQFIAGRVALARALKDSDFATLLQRILDQELKTDRERKLFGLPSRD